MERQLKMNPTVEVWSSAEEWSELKRYSKQFMLLMLLTVTFIMLIGVGSYMRQDMLSEQNANLPALEIRKAQLEGILSEELPRYEANANNGWLSPTKLSLWFFNVMTNASLLDPASIVASEMLFNSIEEQSTLIHGGDPSIAPIDSSSYTPIDNSYIDELVAQAESGVSTSPHNNNNDVDGSPISEDDSQKEDNDGGSNKEGTTEVDEKAVAFIYHTHNRESWSSESENDAQSNDKNITLVGQRLAEELEKLGLGAMVSDTDYPTAVPDYEWEYSYKYSKKTVKEALTSNDELKYVFDLHRDSQPRKYTTAEINGESYAQVYFIIGQRNPNWEKNKAFAVKLHDKLEEQYPGLSRGIWGKNANSGNAEYNQTLSDQSVLIEVGGVDNTLEECYRTAKALAEVIAQIHNEE